MNVSDDQLLARAQSGDADALALLLERHAPDVRQRLATAIPQRWQSVLALEDVMQEAFTDAFLAIGRFTSSGPGGFTAWLTTLARHNLLDAIKMLEAEKRGGRRHRVDGAPRNIDESYVALIEVISASMTSPSGDAAKLEARISLREAVEKLPDTYRTVVELYDLEGRPIEYVAAHLKRSSGAVYMLRGRAHRMLAELMGAPGNYLSTI